MVASGDEFIGNLATYPEGDHVSLLIGVAVSAVTCVVVVLALISCVYFRKWKYRKRRSQDAAFYMNAGFDDFPQGPQQIPGKKTTQTTVPNAYPPTTSNGAALCTLSDLPPHPATSLYKAYPTPYQLDPHGYTEQNLFASQQSPHNSPRQQQEGTTKTMGELSVDPPPSSSEQVRDDNLNDIMYSNPGAKEFAQDVGVDITDGTESGYDTIDLKDSQDEKRQSFIIENTAAFHAIEGQRSDGLRM